MLLFMLDDIPSFAVFSLMHVDQKNTENKNKEHENKLYNFMVLINNSLLILLLRVFGSFEALTNP